MALSRAVVTEASPHDAVRAQALLYAASRLFDFCEEVGLELSEELLSRPAVIERFVAVGLSHYSLATRRTLRANLRYLATTRHAQPAVPALGRGRAKPPYSPAELAAYFALAEAQSTESRRRRLGAVLCLGAGAGLIGRELRGLRGTDVFARSGGLLAVVRTGRPRVVPVRAEYHDRLAPLAAEAGNALLVGGVKLERKNVTAGLIGTLAGGADLLPLDTGRLRASWLVAQLSEIGLPALLEAAGIVCPQRLGDLVGFCAPLGEEAVVALLGGRR